MYGLFQVYPPRLWGPDAPGIEHDVWTLLRVLFAARPRGEFDVPIVFQWGFDIHTFDDDVVRAFDGQIFCNPEQRTYWTTPVAAGGAGLDLFDDCPVTELLDGDRPKQEFMTDDFAPRLSAASGEVHTVCIGRPFNIDYVAMARDGIHLHVYGNGVNDVLDLVARDLLDRDGARHVDLVRAHLHPHESLQPIGRSWAEVQAWKSRWVAEFSRYDAGWSYIGSPFPWRPLEDAAAIPNRLSTYLSVGLPVITDVRPGSYRFEYLADLGVDVDLVDADYGALRASLESETRRGSGAATRSRPATASRSTPRSTRCSPCSNGPGRTTSTRPWRSAARRSPIARDRLPSPTNLPVANRSCAARKQRRRTG